ncbi:SpoIIE family protein phosphatase [Paracrocinitomix mangrovi]|uniref:SpoIIE family protein phosphatase n=1 Tax=Paracrocinitomix mangrovi TaxID=2862509 RepID=UPI001C8DF1C1|nr:SpoIIE family protein phosphatase [Paracrocinitomix mangrovi]UKN01441.1 SpoIIE family protein phosphatase [Paracrocinitomix mangrovi]
MKYLITLLLLMPLFVLGQRKADHVYVEGTVMGYSLDLTGIFKKEKIQIQGSLSGASVKAKGGSVSESAKTDNGGNFGLYLLLGNTYTITYSKSGYGTSSIKLDVRNVDDEMKATGLILKNLEFLLNENESDKPIDQGTVFATVYFDESAREFKTRLTEFDKKDRLFKEIEDNAPMNLVKSSVAKNKGLNKTPESVEIVEETPNNTNNVHTPNHNVTNNSVEEVEEVTTTGQKKLTVLPSSKLTDVNAWGNLTNEDFDNRKKELSDAWDQLEKDKLIAVTEEDFMLIQAREELLIAAEKELEAAKAYIDEQEGKLSAQRKFLFALIGLLLILGGFVFILIRSIKEKKRSNFELEKRNRKIRASINYAERIQRSVLLTEAQIHAMLPNSFVFYQPLDVVSGDFYWFAEVDGKVVMAAVDCTGHGVPGAFMSLIGNTLMNQIVKEKKITSPAEILNKLHQGIVESLNQEHDEAAAQDGMDLSICTLDKNSKTLTFAGAMNPLYIVQGNEIMEVNANYRGIGGVISRKKKTSFDFKEEKIKIEDKANIYMFSDGYMDQFGGTKNEKFNISRFKDLLVSIKDQSMNDQKESVERAINDWKGSTHQIDDMLVIGVKVG